MEKSQKDGDLAPLLSSYGLITAERILGRYNITLTQQAILAVVKNTRGIYYHILRLPFKNILDGIIIQQAHDYYVYLQKLFIDYLLTGETGKSEDMPGVSTRELMEEERQQLLYLGNTFHDLQTEQDKLIAESQAALIGFASAMKITSNQSIKCSLQVLHTTGIDILTIEKALNHALVYADLSEKNALNTLFFGALGVALDDSQKQILTQGLTDLNTLLDSLDDTLNDFIRRADDISRQANSFRTQFYNLILRVKELITLLPEYKHDVDQENKNKESLYFDASIGGEG